ncbi:MAG: uracil-DNA glycosylase [Lachnospiraceae bacterium]|nr:uracil-DNA glycosylase [Lachnospiraceae bacterium]
MNFVDNDWKDKLEKEFNKDYFLHLQEQLLLENEEYTIYPPENQIFRAYELCSFADIKVVILGQDPYFNAGQANGLAFSLHNGVKITPTLRNIFKELEDDLQITNTKTDLTPWAKQGVFLLNTVLTVRAGQANSHKGIGWEEFTDETIRIINKEKNNIIFVLWGANAIKKEKMIDKNKDFVITAPHPSPLSSYRGFFGSKPFSRVNDYLVQIGEEPIEWEL